MEDGKAVFNHNQTQVKEKIDTRQELLEYGYTITNEDLQERFQKFLLWYKIKTTINEDLTDVIIQKFINKRGFNQKRVNLSISLSSKSSVIIPKTGSPKDSSSGEVNFHKAITRQLAKKRIEIDEGEITRLRTILRFLTKHILKEGFIEEYQKHANEDDETLEMSLNNWLSKNWKESDGEAEYSEMEKEKEKWQRTKNTNSNIGRVYEKLRPITEEKRNKMMEVILRLHPELVILGPSDYRETQEIPDSSDEDYHGDYSEESGEKSNTEKSDDQSDDQSSKSYKSRTPDI
ncbi:hypothetical protein C1646_767969 [Rhizophagus diaphanus]|nr:hypothetical protein C1646_767969 [Rhizophagus diaphanus] [Rhizophagus sp. MUCL 43196]